MCFLAACNIIWKAIYRSSEDVLTDFVNTVHNRQFCCFCAVLVINNSHLNLSWKLTHLSFYLSAYLSIFYRPIYLSAYLSLYQPIYLIVCMSVYMSFCLSVCLSFSICISLYDLAIQPNVHPSIHSSFYVFQSSFCLLIYLSLLLSFCQVSKENWHTGKEYL